MPYLPTGHSKTCVVKNIRKFDTVIHYSKIECFVDLEFPWESKSVTIGPKGANRVPWENEAYIAADTMKWNPFKAWSGNHHYTIAGQEKYDGENHRPVFGCLVQSASFLSSSSTMSANIQTVSSKCYCIFILQHLDPLAN